MIKRLQSKSECVQIHHSSIIAKSYYFEKKLPGTYSKMYLRLGVLDQLILAAKSLPQGFSFYIFDAFRSIQTQNFLFRQIFEDVKIKFPALSEQQTLDYARRFAADPLVMPFMPHNSGGAIDITLIKDGKFVDMGTPFDDVSALAQTDYFKSYKEELLYSKEQQELIHQNRQMLKKHLEIAGFINYKEEWWHYDLGSYLWAQAMGSDWFYESMEPLYLEKIVQKSAKKSTDLPSAIFSN